MDLPLSFLRPAVQPLANTPSQWPHRMVQLLVSDVCCASSNVMNQNALNEVIMVQGKILQKNFSVSFKSSLVLFRGEHFLKYKFHKFCWIVNLRTSSLANEMNVCLLTAWHACKNFGCKIFVCSHYYIWCCTKQTLWDTHAPMKDLVLGELSTLWNTIEPAKYDKYI